MEVLCSYQETTINSEKYYHCLIQRQMITANYELKLFGQHEGIKTNDFITYIEFRKCTLTQVPKGLTKIFPNLKIIKIFCSNLKKISRNDLIEYRQVKQLLFYDSEIEFLPERLFEGFENLEVIQFKNHKLEVIAPNILDGLTKLKKVDFSENKNYNMLYSTFPDDRTNETLESFKNLLCKKFQQNSKLYKIYMQHENSQFIFKMEKCIIDDLKALIEDDSTKDFKIIIEKREFSVHKFLLIARSPTLAEILKNNPDAENLNLVDIQVEIFEKILQFIYTDELPDEFGFNFSRLYEAAAKLKIQELMNYAAFKIAESITEENAIDILKLSNKFKNKSMQCKAFEALKKKYPDVVFKADFASNMNKIEQFEEAVKRREEADKALRNILDD